MREPPELHSQQHPESGWHASSELGIGFWGARTCLGDRGLGDSVWVGKSGKPLLLQLGQAPLVVSLRGIL